MNTINSVGYTLGIHEYYLKEAPDATQHVLDIACKHFAFFRFEGPALYIRYIYMKDAFIE
jgi:hypothetical protein